MGLSDNENYSNSCAPVGAQALRGVFQFLSKKPPHFFQKITQFLSRKTTEMPQGQEVPQGQVTDIYRNL